MPTASGWKTDTFENLSSSGALIMAKYICVVLATAVLTSCSPNIGEQKQLIDEMVLYPKRMKETFQNTQINIEESLEGELTSEAGVYVAHFEKFKGEYQLIKVIESWGDAHDTLFQSIYISDMGGENRTEFQFMRTDGVWMLSWIGYADVVP